MNCASIGLFAKPSAENIKESLLNLAGKGIEKLPSKFDSVPTLEFAIPMLV